MHRMKGMAEITAISHILWDWIQKTEKWCLNIIDIGCGRRIEDKVKCSTYLLILMLEFSLCHIKVNRWEGRRYVLWMLRFCLTLSVGCVMIIVVNMKKACEWKWFTWCAETIKTFCHSYVRLTFHSITWFYKISICI